MIDKVKQIQSGVALANRAGRDGEMAVVVPNLPKARTLEPFGFSHLGASGDGSDQHVYLGDGEGLIATGLSKSATNFTTGIGIDSNANFNKHVKHNPILIDKITTTVSNMNQQSKEIFYCVKNIDGEIDKVNLSKYFRADQRRSDEQTTIAAARFAGGLILGPFSCLLFHVDDTYTLEANLVPLASRV